MNYILDILSILIILVLSIYGLKVGFFGSTINVVLVVACFLGAGILSYITVLNVFGAWGWVNSLGFYFVELLGNSKIAGGQAIVNTVAYWLAFALLFIITFIIYGGILNAIRGLIIKLSKGARKAGFIRFIDNFLGFIVNLLVALCLVLLPMAFVHAFRGTVLFVNLNEMYMATDILSLIYDINPFNPLFTNGKLVESLVQSFSAFIG